MSLPTPQRMLTRPALTGSRPQLSDRASRGSASAIRDLLDQAKRPGMISLAGGLPDASLFPTIQLAEIARRVITDQGEHVLQYGLTQGDSDVCDVVRALFTPKPTADRLVIPTTWALFRSFAVMAPTCTRSQSTRTA